VIVAFATLAGAPAAVAADDPYRGWTRARGDSALPLDVHVDTGAGMQTLGAWLGGRPAVLTLWATWCGPCLAEKPAQARMDRRLAAYGSRARILALQIYDNVDLTRGRAVLARLGAEGLTNAAAQSDAEAAFIRLLGASEIDGARTSMPWHLLVDSNGRELARSLGLMRGLGRRYTYFEDDATFAFLSELS